VKLKFVRQGQMERLHAERRKRGDYSWEEIPE
jgi:hypothetical protein